MIGFVRCDVVPRQLTGLNPRGGGGGGWGPRKRKLCDCVLCVLIFCWLDLVLIWC